MNKYDWKARESAPKSFPMRVVEGNFYDSEGGSLYVPDRRTIHQGWGYGVSSHVVGADKKILPNRLEITCFSYGEDKFYTGKFDLPYERILGLFKKGYYSPKMGENITFDSLVVGVAPGGYLTVWATGIDKRVEVFAGNMEEDDVPWERVLNNPQVSRKEYLHIVLNDSLDDQEYEKIKQNRIPFGLWKKYATRYKWLPSVTGVDVPEIIKEINFVNGERDYYSLKYQNNWEGQLHSVPTEMTLKWEGDEGPAELVELVFNTENIITAFEELSLKTTDTMYLNIDISSEDKGFSYSPALISGDYRVPIDNTSVRIF